MAERGRNVLWQYLALFWVTGCLQSLHLPWYGFLLRRLDISATVIASSDWQRHAWKRLFARSLFSPTLRDPSLMLLELAVNGSGAATFESFYGYDEWCVVVQGKQLPIRICCRPWWFEQKRRGNHFVDGIFYKTIVVGKSLHLGRSCPIHPRQLFPRCQALIVAASLPHPT